MRKIKLYIATSLNGKIAKPDGSVDWLESIPNLDGTDHGYSKFYKSIDTTIQGYKTYELILNRGIEIPSADKKNYVITRKQHLANTEHVEFIKENHIDSIKHLKKQEGKDIWLIGGGQINTLLLNENLIDEMQIFVMPIVILDGIDLFELAPMERMFKLIKAKSYSTGVVELKYKIE